MASAATDKLIVTTEEAELRKKGYTLGSTLGEGSYAKVKSAHSSKEKKNVAIKIINQRRAPKDFKERFLPRELEILQSIRHENLVNLYEIFRMNGKVCIINRKWLLKKPVSVNISISYNRQYAVMLLYCYKALAFVDSGY